MDNLEILSKVDTIVVEEGMQLLESKSGHSDAKPQNIYRIYNSAIKAKSNFGQQIMLAKENNSECMRICYGNARAAKIIFTSEASSQDVMTLQSYLSFLGKMDVFGPSRELLGRVDENFSTSSSLNVTNESGQTLFKIRGPVCICDCATLCHPVCDCGDVNFEVTSETTDSTVATIQKQWGQFAKTDATNGDNFSIDFHDDDLDAKEKALLLGSLFLVHLLYFEANGRCKNLDIFVFVLVLITVFVVILTVLA